MKKKIIKLIQRLRVLRFLNLNFRTTINNHTFKIPILKGVGIQNTHISEPWMIQLLEKIIELKKDKCYIDVGVNIGQTLLKLKSVSTGMDYWGFEPNPACVYYVNELVKINRFENVNLIPVGIASETGIYELSFIVDSDVDSAASMVTDFRPNQTVYRKEYIACFNASDFLEKYTIPPIGILKIDVEGAESEVIEGLRERIITDQPFIQVEILPVYSESNDDRLFRQNKIESLFAQMNYTLFRLQIDETDHLAGLQEIETIGIHSNLKWCEYFAIPNSYKAAVTKLIDEI